MIGSGIAEILTALIYRNYRLSQGFGVSVEILGSNKYLCGATSQWAAKIVRRLAWFVISDMRLSQLAQSGSGSS